MELVLLTTQRTLLILKGPYTAEQQTAIKAVMPGGVTVIFVGDAAVDTMDALAIQFTGGAPVVNINPTS